VTTYYRYTNKDNPMSDWGHAMFVDNADESAHYGVNCYTYTDNNTIGIGDLEQVIKNTWEQNDNFDFIDDYYRSLTADEIFDSFCPDDIVSSANGWDCELVQWFWDCVAEPNNVSAVLTPNGAIVFDEDLIIKQQEDE